MRFLVNDVVYDVMFTNQYREDHYFGRASGPLKDTRCTISTVDESAKGPEKYECVGEGRAYLSHNDERDFDKWVGRKLAFGRALHRFSKEDRAEFWRIYKDRFPGRKFGAKVSMDGCKDENSIALCIRKIEDLPVQPRQTEVTINVTVAESL